MPFKLTIDSSVIAADLTNFPVTIKLGASVGKNTFDGTDVFDKIGKNWKKLRVLVDEVSCPVEVEEWPGTMWSFPVEVAEFSLGSDNDGYAGLNSINGPTIETDHVSFNGTNQGIYKVDNLGVTNNEAIHAIFRIGNKASGAIQTIWKDGGSSNGYALGIDASGNLGVFGRNTSLTSITIDGTEYENDVIYEVFANKSEFHLYNYLTGALVAIATGTLDCGAGTANMSIGYGSEQRVIAGISSAGSYFEGDVFFVGVYNEDTAVMPVEPTAGETATIHVKVPTVSSSADTDIILAYDPDDGDNSDINVTGYVGASDLFDQDMGNTDSVSTAGYTRRIVIKPAAFEVVGGNSVRIAFMGSATAWTVGSCYIGFVDPTEDGNHFESTPVQVTKDTATSFDVTEDWMLSDWVDFEFDDTKKIMVSCYHTGNGNARNLVAINTTKFAEYYAVSDVAADLDPGAMTSVTTRYEIVRGIEVASLVSPPNYRVWDDNFVAVYHMAQDPSEAGACILDSTSNTNDGTPSGTMTSDDLVDMAVGKGIHLDGVDDFIDLGTIAGLTNWTFEALVEPKDTTSGDGIIHIDGDGLVFSDGYTAGMLASDVDIRGNTVVNDSEIHLVVTWDGATMYFYEDGVEVGTALSNDGWALSGVARIGNGYSSRKPEMIIGTATVSDMARSADWIKLTNLSLTDALLTFANYTLPVNSLSLTLDSSAISVGQDDFPLTVILDDENEVHRAVFSETDRVATKVYDFAGTTLDSDFSLAQSNPIASLAQNDGLILTLGSGGAHNGLTAKNKQSVRTGEAWEVVFKTTITPWYYASTPGFSVYMCDALNTYANTYYAIPQKGIRIKLACGDTTESFIDTVGLGDSTVEEAGSTITVSTEIEVKITFDGSIVSLYEDNVLVISKEIHADDLANLSEYYTLEFHCAGYNNNGSVIINDLITSWIDETTSYPEKVKITSGATSLPIEQEKWDAKNEPVIETQYPPSHSSTYVKATSYFSTSYYPHNCTNPALPVTGTMTSNCWLSVNTVVTNQKLNIDLGEAKIIRQIYIENNHHSGSQTDTGIRNFTLLGTNESTTFDETTYSVDNNLTEIGSYTAEPHTAVNQAEPKYIKVDNDLAFRYYVLKIADCWGATSYMGIRHIELQTAKRIAVLHTKVPTYSSRVDTKLILDYTATNAVNPLRGLGGSVAAQDVWNDNFVGIYHMSQDPSLGDILDSTGNSFDLTPTNLGASNLVNGQFGKAIDFTANDQELSAAGLDLSGMEAAFTLEALHDLDAVGSWTRMVLLDVFNGSPTLVGYDTGGKYNIGVAYDDTEGAISMGLDGYHHVAYTGLAGAIELTQDGVKDAVTASTTIADLSSTTLYVGNDGSVDASWLDGRLGEVRLSDIVRSDNWIKLTNLSLTDQLITYVLIPPDTGPVVAKELILTLDSSVITEDQTDFPLTVVLDGDDQLHAKVFAELGANYDKVHITVSGVELPIEVASWNTDTGYQVNNNVHDAAHVKATLAHANYNTYMATNPDLPLTGTYDYNSWLAVGSTGSLKFNVDLGSAKTVTRIYLENMHTSGGNTDQGIKNFVVYGTNESTAFDNVTYATLDDLVELGTFGATEHTAVDESDPQYFDFENDTAYQYYILRIADNWGGGSTNIRHIEFHSPLTDFGILHTKVPIYSASVDTVLTLDYTSTNAINTLLGVIGSTEGQAVWDDDFIAVIHMGQDPTGGADSVLDSTADYKDATPVGFEARDLIDNKTGLFFDKTDNALTLPAANSLFADHTNITLEFQAQLDKTSTDSLIEHRLFTMDSTTVSGAFLAFGVDENKLAVNVYTGTHDQLNGPDYPVGTEFVSSLTKEGTLYTLFQDGVAHGSNLTATDGTPTANPAYIGQGWTAASDRRWYGGMKEARISKIVRSDSWLALTTLSLKGQLITFSEPVEVEPPITSLYLLAGVVREKNVPVDRKVVLYRRDTNVLVDTTTSSGSVGYRFETSYSGEHYIVCLDDDAGTNYNALIQDRLIGTLV